MFVYQRVVWGFKARKYGDVGEYNFFSGDVFWWFGDFIWFYGDFMVILYDFMVIWCDFMGYMYHCIGNLMVIYGDFDGDSMGSSGIYPLDPSGKRLNINI